MAEITYIEAETGLDDLLGKGQSADKNVSNALSRFETQVTTLANIMSATSDEMVLVDDIIETAARSENLASPVWIGAKNKAEVVKAELAARLAKYQAALPTVKALRNA